MKIYAYPADEQGCGNHRIIWPAEALQRVGHDITIVRPKERANSLSATMNVDGTRLIDVKIPEDADVIVLQRITHKYLVEAIALMRQRYGVAVVVDIDDDLAVINPNNPAFTAMHPVYGVSPNHNWNNAALACAAATWVQVSTPALLPHYAPHDRGTVVYNCIPKRYLSIPHEDSTTIGWAGSVHSHPGDLDVVGIGVSGVLSDTVRYRAVGPVPGVQEALRLPYEPESTGPVNGVTEWPQAIARLGIGIAPLADTRFNRGKSWLKPLEYSALGVPWVASPRAEYQRLHDLGAGLLANKPKQWLTQLRKLTTDSILRTEMSQWGRELAANWTIEGNAEKWFEVWHSAYDYERGSASSG